MLSQRSALHWPRQVRRCCGAKGQSNHVHLAKTLVKGSVYVCVSERRCPRTHTATRYKPLTKRPISCCVSACYLSIRSAVCFLDKRLWWICFAPKKSSFPPLLFSLCASQDNRLIGALKQPEAWNEARRGVQSQRYTRIMRERGKEKKKKVEGRKERAKQR